MLGRIRASASSLDSLEGSPSKILKDDSFSIYEATLMKLKLGARRDTSSEQMEEAINNSSVTSPCTEEANVNMNHADCTPATASSDGIMSMDTDTGTDCSSMTTSPSFSDAVSTVNSDQQKHSNVSILHFFKIKDTGEPTSTKNGSFGSISSSGSVESKCTNETETTRTFRDCQLSE